MPRLQGVSDRDAGPGARIAFFFTRRKLARMIGRETAGMLEPLRLYAHIPRLLNAYGGLEQAESKLDVLSPRHRALAELKSATTVRWRNARSSRPSSRRGAPASSTGWWRCCIPMWCCGATSGRTPPVSAPRAPPATVAELARSYAAPERESRAAAVNGAAGAVIAVAGRPSAIMAFLVRDGRVAAISTS
jgi:hypothetical protein